MHDTKMNKSRKHSNFPSFLPPKVEMPCCGSCGALAHPGPAAAARGRVVTLESAEKAAQNACETAACPRFFREFATVANKLGFCSTLAAALPADGNMSKQSLSKDYRVSTPIANECIVELVSLNVFL